MIHSLPIAAVFSNPLMLWGLGAASLPIIIHLLNRRKFREMPWAAMRFLLAAMKKNQRRVRIEQWLLLAIRTAIIVCAVLAMAKPVLESLGAMALLPGQRTHWVLALDGSMSMSYRAGESSRFDHAKALAAQLVKTARQGDVISVVLMASPPRAIIGEPTPNRDAVAKEIAEIQPTDGGTDLTACFTKVDEVLAASDVPRKELVFLTDLQAASWSRAKGDDGLKRAIAKLEAREVRSSVIDLGSANDLNRAVAALRLDPPIVTPHVPVTIQATLRDFGRAEGANARARLIIDGKIEGEQETHVPAGEGQTVLFLSQFSTPGEHTVEVQLDKDALEPDDVRRLVVPVRESIRVLLVDGDPKPEALKSETAFLVEAISPEPLSGEPPPTIDADVIGESQLAGRDLTVYDALVLANVARLTRTETTALESFVKQGGGLVVFTGDRVVVENYNELLYNEGKGLLPAELGLPIGDLKRPETPFEFDPLGFKHPIIADYAGEGPKVIASLTNARTFRYHPAKLPRGSAAQVALAFSTGDPAIIEGPRFRGRTILVTTSAEPGWTSWPQHQSYAVVMEQIVMLAASGRAAERNVSVGQPFVQAFPPNMVGATATLRRPDDTTAAVKLEADSEIGLLRYDNTDRAGLYRAQIGAPLDREVNFAANPDPLESDPAKLDAAGLRAAVPGWEFHYDNDWTARQQDASSVSRRGELHQSLLWTVLALLFIESILAWRFGHHAPRSRTA